MPTLRRKLTAVGIITASGCGVMVKDYGYQLSRDPAYAQKAAFVSELTRDISEENQSPSDFLGDALVEIFDFREEGGSAKIFDVDVHRAPRGVQIFP